MPNNDTAVPSSAPARKPSGPAGDQRYAAAAAQKAQKNADDDRHQRADQVHARQSLCVQRQPFRAGADGGQVHGHFLSGHLVAVADGIDQRLQLHPHLIQPDAESRGQRVPGHGGVQHLRDPLLELHVHLFHRANASLLPVGHDGHGSLLDQQIHQRLRNGRDELGHGLAAV